MGEDGARIQYSLNISYPEYRGADGLGVDGWAWMIYMLRCRGVDGRAQIGCVSATPVKWGRLCLIVQ